MKAPRVVVIIDSAEKRREALYRLIVGEGVGVSGVAAHGIGAAEALGALRPDLVFISVEEPFAPASHTIEYLRARLPDAPIVAYSAGVSTPLFQLVVRAGATHLIESPVQPGQIQALIERLLGESPAPGAAPLRGGRVITVVGQKGGIGKTTISVNLAAALARQGNGDVLLVDFDVTFGDVAIALDVAPTATAARVATRNAPFDRESFREQLIAHESGAFILPAPARAGEQLRVQPDELEALVTFGACMFDYVIVDTPGTFNEAVAAGLSVADHAIVATSFERSSVKNAALLLSVLREEDYPEDRVLVVANHTQPEPAMDAAEMAAILCVGAVWEVPYDSAVRRSTQAGKPVTMMQPKSPASASLRALAGRIATSPEKIDRRNGVRGPQSQRGGRSLQDRLHLAFSRARLPLASGQ